MPRAIAAAVLALATAAFAAHAQWSGGLDFELMTIAGGDRLVFTPDGLVITGGADLAFYSRDPAEGRLRLRGDRIERKGAASGENALHMSGNVIVDDPNGRTIAADRCDYLESRGEMVFEGNVRVELAPGSPPITGSRLTYNVETGEVVIDRPRGQDIPVQELTGAAGRSGRGEASGPLEPGSVRDWPGFLTRLKEQHAAPTPSPGKRIVQLAGAELAQSLAALNTSVEPPGQVKRVVVARLNALLNRRDLYDASAWEGVALDTPTAALAEQGPAALDAEALVRFNLGLLRTAFPELAASP